MDSEELMEMLKNVRELDRRTGRTRRLIELLEDDDGTRISTQTQHIEWMTTMSDGQNLGVKIKIEIFPIKYKTSKRENILVPKTDTELKLNEPEGRALAAHVLEKV